MASKEWERANREKRAAQRKAWGLANRDRLAANQRRYHASEKGQAKAKARRRPPEQIQAINKLNWALQSGRIEFPGVCEDCGREGTRYEIHAHHDDYSKPYDVRWLCRSCHMEHHYVRRGGR